MSGAGLAEAVETGVAAAVLSLASLGDGLSARREEIERLAKRSGAAPVR